MIDFSLHGSDGKFFNLNECIKPLILFFYPKDNTPGCIIENQDFARLYQDFLNLGYEVIGISRDTIKTHCNFIGKFSLPFKLLSDDKEIVCNLFNVIKHKKMFGKEVKGIERSTFIIDKNKNIIKEWRKVNVTGHAKEVLEYIKSLNK